jgi:superfamily I DNA and/or RNA helicase
MVLREKNLRDVKVGSVAEFQGKEYKALFISTVRASRHWFEHDKKYGLGLLKDQRALNTALSRVTSLLVVVGDPYVLSMVREYLLCLVSILLLSPLRCRTTTGRRS